MKAEFPSLQHSLLLWLLDTMSSVVLNKDVNKMTAVNMAIVVSPNLFSVETENPMVAMAWTTKVAEFMKLALRSRLFVLHGVES